MTTLYPKVININNYKLVYIKTSNKATRVQSIIIEDTLKFIIINQ